MRRWLPLVLLWGAFPAFTLFDHVEVVAQPGPDPPAELIVHNGKVVTLDPKGRVVQALAIRDGRVVAVGADQDVLKHKGAKTRVLDAGGRTVLPGLYDSHTHPVGAATSELVEPLPSLKSLDDVFAYVRKKTTEVKEGEWIVLRFAFPTRLKEARFPTRAELDRAAPKH